MAVVDLSSAVQDPPQGGQKPTFREMLAASCGIARSQYLFLPDIALVEQFLADLTTA